MSALLRDHKLPELLKPYMKRLEALYNEKDDLQPRKNSNSNFITINDKVLNMLITRLNEEPGETRVWMSPEAFCLLSEDEAVGKSPVQAWGFFHKRVTHLEVGFSTFSSSQKDSFVAFRLGSTKKMGFGRIFSIFTHSTSSRGSLRNSQVWLQVQQFPEIPEKMEQFDPYRLVKTPEAQVFLCAWGPTKDCVTKLQEVVAHCTWMMYRPGLIHKKLDIPTVALVVNDR